MGHVEGGGHSTLPRALFGATLFDSFGALLGTTPRQFRVPSAGHFCGLPGSSTLPRVRFRTLFDFWDRLLDTSGCPRQGTLRVPLGTSGEGSSLDTSACPLGATLQIPRGTSGIPRCTDSTLRGIPRLIKGCSPSSRSTARFPTLAKYLDSVMGGWGWKKVDGLRRCLHEFETRLPSLYSLVEEGADF